MKNHQRRMQSTNKFEAFEIAYKDENTHTSTRASGYRRKKKEIDLVSFLQSEIQREV